MGPRDKQIADALGLVINDGSRTLDLEDGVKLTFRPPEGADWSAAGTEVGTAMANVRSVADARKLYGFDGHDVTALADPKSWESTAEWCVSVHLAARIVTRIERHVGEQVLSVDPDVEAFAFLFKLGENHAQFLKEAKRAGRELITAKKE